MSPSGNTPTPCLPSPREGLHGWPWVGAIPEVAKPGDTNWPRITLVTPSYQQARFLEECLRSVLLQGYPNLEFVVMDGGSTDGSVEIIARYAPFLSHWQSQRDGGQGHAINLGFARATGEIMGWLNSDDMLLPGALFAVALAFLHSRAEIVYGDALNAYEEDGSVEYWRGYWVRSPFLQFGGIISSHAVFWRRSVHVPIWEELHCNVDGELWQRLVPGRRLRYLPQPLGVCRIHSDTKSSNEQWLGKWREDDERIWSRHGRPNRGRLFRKWYSTSQRVFKAAAWIRNKAKKRAIIAACGWYYRPWRGPKP